MSKLVLFLGILLMIGAIGILLFFVLLPEDMQSNQSVAAIHDALFCSPGEHYRQDIGGLVYGSDTQPLGRELTIYCENNEGQPRDVTGRSIAIMMGAFAVPFVLGLFMTIGSSIAMTARWSRRLMASAGSPPVTVYTNVPGKGVQHRTTVTQLSDAQVPAEAAEMIQQIMAGFQASAAQMQADEPNDLVSKLRQLEEARSANLISASEYDRLRQQILDRMDD
ncbi:MAG: gas vesicle protein GvpG [Anaerolineae bacterium]|nr:gas vesicle protein GvpG [Anaerolineae bacterium]